MPCTGSFTLLKPGRGRPRRLVARALEDSAQRCSSSAGFTLVELLVAIVLGITVIGGASDFILTSLRQTNTVSSRTAAVTQAEVFLARMTREVREAQHIANTTTGANTSPVNVTYGGGSSSVSFYLPKAGSTELGTQVTWTCTGGEEGSCTRKEGTGSAATELIGVKEATFTPYGSSGSELASGAGAASSPSYPSSIFVALVVRSISQSDKGQTHIALGDSNPITIRDGVGLRNYS